MFELKGKNNICKVFTDNCDSETISQLTMLLNQDSVNNSKIRIMPDTHAGKGCVIGTTMTIKDTVIPNLVGLDVGCGMLAVKLQVNEIDLDQLDAVIRKYVPSGFSVHERAICEFDFSKMIAKVNVDRAEKSIGTLGGGNHFIEVNRGSDGHLWLVIHTGSRHLGTEVCKHYQDLAYDNIRNNGVQKKIEETVARLKKEGKEHEIENTIKVLKMQTGPVPKDLCYLEGEDMASYLNDMKIAQEFAYTNRKYIARSILSNMGLSESVLKSFQTIHNYIDTDKLILRKGAVSSELGEELIIPMNMRDGSLICIGKGNEDWNCSAPHGAGRLMSRSQAKNQVSLEEFEESMKGIYTTCVSTSTIDESPMAYKPMDEIILNVKDTVDIIECIKPIYNYKAN
mgnify:CR=1 FL=1